MKSAERVLDALELLARRTYPTPTMTIAVECGIPKSTAHNLLNTLSRRQFVTYYRRERAWGLGQRVFEMASDAPLLAHAMVVLQAFEPSCPYLSAADIVRRTDLRPNTVHGLLPALEKTGLINCSADGRYRLGTQLFSLAMQISTLDRLRSAARPVLTALRNQTGETANLVVQESPNRAVYVDQIESPRALRHAGWVGKEIPIEGSATGAALADKSTSHVAVDTIEMGVTAVACAVPGWDDPPLVVSITGPTLRLQKHDLVHARTAVEAAALDLSRRWA